MNNDTFDDIRPYYDSEVAEAMQRIARNDFFLPVTRFLFNDINVEEFRNKVSSISTADQLQTEIMHPIIQSIVAKTTNGFTFSGAENLSRERGMLFVSNHRDITLDSFLLQYMLFLNSIPTGEITFGDNLMINQFIIDIGKSNKMFKVTRKGDDLREFLANSRRLSQYIRYTLLQKNTSIWIAQRNGRTKDGNDATDQGLIKMFGMSGSRDYVKTFDELHIVPVSVSYEKEPCDVLKMREKYATRNGEKYVKGSNEDFNSILTGITYPKGRVHISVCKSITREELETISLLGNNEFHNALAKLIDRRIHSAYKLFPNNYIAHDLRGQKSEFAQYYSDEQKNSFEKRLSEAITSSEGDKNILKSIYLGIYANPIDNRI